MTARFIILSVIVLALFVVTSWPLIVETAVDLLRRINIRADLGSFDDET